MSLTCQQFKPRPYWVSNAPLIPIPQDAPAPPAAFASPEAAAIDKESYQESEGEQAAEIAHQVWGSILEEVGIYSEYVEMEIEDVCKLAYSAAQQACVASSKPSMPTTFKQALASCREQHGGKLADRK